MTDQTSIAEPQEISIEEIKANYPGEWVLLGNPVRAENGVDIVSGILIDHSRDKRELAYRWRGNLAAYDKYTFINISESLVLCANTIGSFHSSPVTPVSYDLSF